MNSFHAGIVTSLVLSITALAEVRLPPLFADNMVIQRETHAPIWGWATPGEAVTVTASWGEKASATTGTDGRWLVRLATPQAGGPHTLEIRAGAPPLSGGPEGQTITLENVLSGDIWVCAGQSNMEWHLQQTAGASEEIARADFPQIRHFKIAAAATPEIQKQYQGSWALCSPQSAGRFTAVGYYFAKEIHTRKNVPIGLLGINCGGTRIEPWLSPEGVRSMPGLRKLAEELDRMDPATESYHATFAAYVETVKAWLPQAEQSLARCQAVPPIPEKPEWSDRRDPRQNATFLYNGMVAPILPFAIKGVIWYQGESNGSESREVYRDKMEALIRGWRAALQQPPGSDVPRIDFPFYFVQLPNLQGSSPATPAGGDGWTGVRQAQFDTLALKNTGMAVTIDIGKPENLHPVNKLDVGRRLARWALARDYGEELVSSGPLFKSMEVRGSQAVLLFDHVGRGLMVGRKEGMAPTVEDAGAPLKGFSIRGADNQWHWADAAIDGDHLTVSSPHVQTPVAVRYAYTMNPVGCNLYNREGLPASPFTTEK